MILGATREHGCDDGCSDATSHVSHEIDHPRNTVSFLCGDADITGHRYRDEEKANADHLRYTQPHRKTKADEQIRAIRRVIQTNCQSTPPCRNQIAGLDLCGQPSYDWHH